MTTDVTLEKIEYLMHRAADSEVTPDDLEELVFKVFIGSFEFEYGFEPALIKALVNARAHLREYDAEHEDTPTQLTGEEVEEVYRGHQIAMYEMAGYTKEYAEDSASWPDALPIIADWDRDLLCRLARQEVAHHLVTLDQIREELVQRND